MDAARSLTLLRADADALLVAADAAGLDAPVPSCPEWTVADLLGHLGLAESWVTSVVEQRATEPMWPRALPEPPEPAARPAWLRGVVDHLLEVLAATPPDTPMWTFGPGGTARFWMRRHAIECALHRYDAQLAAGTPAPLDGDLAADGIDELLTVLLPVIPTLDLRGGGETLHLHCTDRDGEWLVRRAAGGLEVERVHAKADVAARGTASELLLLLTGRLAPDAVETFGDVSLLERWQVDAAI